MIFRQFRSVACREYIFPRDDPASQPKGWIQGNMRIGLVLEVTTGFQHFKYGIEIRIESVNQDNSHSWVRISYGTVKYVIDSIQDKKRNSCRSTRRADRKEGTNLGRTIRWQEWEREAFSGTVEMHRHGHVQTREFAHDCRGLQG